MPGLEFNPKCSQCDAAALCGETLDSLGQRIVANKDLLGRSLTEMEETGDLPPGVSRDSLSALSDVILADSYRVAAAVPKAMALQRHCLGTAADGECGLSPRIQLMMMPEWVDPDDPRLRAIAAAADLMIQRGWDPLYN